MKTIYDLQAIMPDNLKHIEEMRNESWLANVSTGMRLRTAFTQDYSVK